MTECPCRFCAEKNYPQCYDNCPVDARGEYGRGAWHREVKAVEAWKREFNLRDREESLRNLRISREKKKRRK